MLHSINIQDFDKKKALTQTLGEDQKYQTAKNVEILFIN